MKRRRTPPKRLRHPAQPVVPGPGVREKLVLVGMDPLGKPVVYGLSNPDDPKDVYRPVTVSKEEMTRIVTDQAARCLRKLADQNERPDLRRWAAATIEDFSEIDQFSGAFRRIDENPAPPDPETILNGMLPHFCGTLAPSRRSILRSIHHESYERIEVEFLRARDRGVEAPIVLVLDPRDHLARDVFSPTIGAHTIANALAEGRRRGREFIIAWGMPTEYGVEDLADVSPEVAHTVDSPAPDGGYWAVVLAEGGAEAFPMPRLP